jgi:hydroxymethylbilane synthase
VSGRSAQRSLRIGTRGSALALAQARLVADALDTHGYAPEIVIIETDGDRRAPDTAWGEGAFVKAIEQTLLDGRADIAVHSAKDVPTDENPALRIAAYLAREDPRDALVVAGTGNGATLDSLPPGSVIGTDSPRRSGFLRARRPDLAVRPLHGNVDTRLGRLDAGEVDALVLAVAGLVRLGRADRISQRLPVTVVPPAPGQGAIAIQVRADDVELIEIGARLDHRTTRRAVEAERAFLHATGGGCRAPVGALAEVTDGRLRILGGLATTDGRLAAVDELSGSADEAGALAERLAAALTDRRAASAGGPRVLVTRAAHESRRLAAGLAEHGIEAVVVPSIDIEPATDGELDMALARLADYAWAVVTSANGARATIDAAVRTGTDLSAARWAAVGEPTARHLRLAGVREVWLPGIAAGEQLGAGLPVEPGQRVLLVRGSLAGEQLPDTLRGRGALVDQVVAYRTLEAPETSRAPLLAALADGRPDAVIFASPSAVRGLLALAPPDDHAAVLSLPAICIGSTTAAAAREAGFTIIARSSTQDSAALAELTARVLGAQRPVPA